MKRFRRILSVVTVVLMLTAAFVSMAVASAENEIHVKRIENSYADSSLCENSRAGSRMLFSRAVFDGCYGNQLSGVARELYDSMKKSFVTDAKTSAYSYTFKAPFTFKAAISGGSIVANDELREVQQELDFSTQAALDAFLYDYPQVYWLKIIGTSYSISASGNSVSGYTGIIKDIEIIPTEIYSGASAKASQYKSALNAALKDIEATESRYETLKNVHDYICDNAWYNLVSEQRVHTSEPFFIGDGGVVCEGYAETFKVICDRLDIPCVLVSGDAGGAHMWNYVQMDDGKWYLVDVTWDDQQSRIYDTYFLANANTVGFDGVAISKERTERNDFSGTGVFSFTYPVLSTTAYTVHTHQWESSYTVDLAPTCTEKGSKSIHCKTCDATKSVTEIPATDHSWNSGRITSVATCKSQGVKTYTCLNNSGHKKTEKTALDYNNHEGGTYLKNTAAATCTADGYSGDVHCKGCDKKLEAGNVIPATDHANKTEHAQQDSTCTEIGYTAGVYCPDCKKWLSGHGEIPELPHAYETVTVPASFTDDGMTQSECSCGDVEFSISIPKLSSVKLSTASCTYNGKTRSPSVSVTDSAGNALVNGTDYDVTIPSGRKNPGVYEYKISFKGNYEGTKTLAFTILPKAPAKISATQSTSVIKLSWSESVGATGYRVYQYSPSKGKYVKIASVKGVTSYRKATNLKPGTEYSFKIKPYTKLSDGTVLWGTASEAFTTATECKAPAITSVTSASKSNATVKWSDVSGETGYQLYYSTSKNGTYKKVNSYAADKLAGSKTFSSSSSGKTIYFKVRAYKKVAGQTVFSEWSAVKSVRLK